MKERGSFGVGLFFAGAVFHVLFGYLWGISAPAPQWLLLCVLAVGAQGRLNTAQTLGFFWGLTLDVNGAALFGSQAWVLAAAGFLTGTLSRNVDAEKPMAQAALALGGTLFHVLFMAGIEMLFRSEGPPHVAGTGEVLLQLVMNSAAAPLVFAGVGAWGRRVPASGEGHVFRS